ncbi:MAG: elongation factor G, partial [Gemmatimonadetes bacterium]|nr:elongation factor G [Gemmatimonadota bacterium]
GEHIRNVAVLGHGASGKTSLVDSLAFVAGTSKRHGSVKDGTALTDYTPDEIERQYSINLALAYAEWKDTKLNLVDTPGYLDFSGDALAGAHAADAALIVVSATAGVEVGTELVNDYATQRALPRLFFVSLIDKEHADFDKVFRAIKDRLTPKVIPIEIPIGEGPTFHGIVNLFTRKAHLYKKGTKTGEYDEAEVPAEVKDRYQQYEQELVETVATTDDALLERYLGGEEIKPAELLAAMHAGVAKGELCPLLCGAGELTYGMRALLDALVDLAPAPTERPPLEVKTWGELEPLVLKAAVDGPFVAHVFKTISEPHVGDVTFFRIYSGTVNNGADVYNAPRDSMEKLNHLSVALGKERTEVPMLHAGDIGIVAKLRNTHTNDTLSTKAVPVALPKIPFPDPVITMAIEVKQRGEEDKLSTGLQKLHEEDPTFHFEHNAELGQTLVRGRGERHLEILVGRLARKFGVHAVLAKPKVAYRETLKGKAEGQGKHKKQTGGRGQYGDCWIRVAPLPRGSGLQFVDEIVGGDNPRQYIPAVEKGIIEAAARGPVAGYPMVDFKVELYDGSYHDVDSNEMSFKMAGIQAFRNVTPNARPVLLEPIVDVEAWTPEEYLGAVMGDLSSRRGQILGSDRDGRLTKVRALVPEAELDRYATTLHSLTHGRGTYRQKFHAYQETPPEVAAKVVEAHKKELEAAEKK